MTDIESQVKPRKQPTQARSRKRVQKVLTATRLLLRDQGLNSVTTSKIAKQAGIPVGSVYQYYPNKKAILVALYSDYLAKIREVFDLYEGEPLLSMEWQEFFENLLQSLIAAEEQGDIIPELVQSTKIYPELKEIENKHTKVVNRKFLAFFRHFGFTGSDAKLIRLSSFLYLLNEGSWIYRSEYKSAQHHKEAANWETAAALGLLNHYRENS
ncbi:MAG: TetR/AcrR family transcriptional regulator [Pseudomonadales bacterium]|nr:TetR/AcrR family transcriptional regulator [Pseudomonadales bacterium]MCP5215520.1 TetR/AcrR family transcriptional regulator [Pseudomonadales bacterium]